MSDNLIFTALTKGQAWLQHMYIWIQCIIDIIFYKWAIGRSRKV